MTLLLRDPASGQTWTLDEGRLIVGRKSGQPPVLQPEDILVALDDSLVSRGHAVICLEDGRFTVTDTDSRDGTYVNDREASGSTPIHDGDRLRFGDTVLVASIDYVAQPAGLTARADHDQTFQAPPPAQVRDADRTIVQASPLLESHKPTAVMPTRAVRGRTTQDREMPAPVVPRPLTAVPAESGPTAIASPAGRQPERMPVASPEPTLVQHVVVSAPSAPSDVSAVPSRLPEVRAGAEQLASALREFEHEVSTAVEMFERNGGRAALETFLSHARRIEAEPRTAEDLQAFFSWLPTGCRMLETELILMNLLSSRASDAPR